MRINLILHGFHHMLNILPDLLKRLGHYFLFQIEKRLLYLNLICYLFFVKVAYVVFFRDIQHGVCLTNHIQFIVISLDVGWGIIEKGFYVRSSYNSSGWSSQHFTITRGQTPCEVDTQTKESLSPVGSDFLVIFLASSEIIS